MTTVCIGYISAQQVHTNWVSCLTDLLVYELTSGDNIVTSMKRHTPATIALGRNDVTKDFLENTSCDWLWFIDTDMVFPPDVVRQLLAYADPTHRPIVGGLCYGVNPDGKSFPVTYQRLNGELTIVPPKDELESVDATGAACLLIHRSVLLEMRAAYSHAAPFEFWAETVVDGTHYGEDMTFCIRADGMGYPIYVATKVKVGHMKFVNVHG